MPTTAASVAAPATLTPRKHGPRLEFIDLLRGMAVVVMIETHTVNALLQTSYRAMGWFDVLDFVNGLVAPSFLFCAGCGLWISLGRRWDDYLHLRKPLWVYFRRLGWILGVGYALHLPNFSLHRMMTALTPADAENLFQVDILHVIVVTLVAVVVLAIIVRNRRAVLWTAIAAAAALIALAPTIWTYARAGGLPLIARNLLTELPTNYFPLVPWSAFVFIGMAATQVYTGAADKRRFFARLFALGLCVFATGTIFRFVYNPWSYTLWRATPIFFAMRIGLVLMFFTGWFWYTEFRKNRPILKTGLMLVFGRESLLVYVTHLIIVYGSVVNNGFAASLRQSFTPVMCAGVAIALIALMYLLARAWMWIKEHLPRVGALIPYAWAVLFLVFLFTND